MSNTCVSQPTIPPPPPPLLSAPASIVDLTVAINRDTYRGILTITPEWVLFDVNVGVKKGLATLRVPRTEAVRVLEARTTDLTSIEIDVWRAEAYRTAHSWTTGVTGSQRVQGETALTVRFADGHITFRTTENPVVIRERLRSLPCLRS